MPPYLYQPIGNRIFKMGFYSDISLCKKHLVDDWYIRSTVIFLVPIWKGKEKQNRTKQKQKHFHLAPLRSLRRTPPLQMLLHKPEKSNSENCRCLRRGLIPPKEAFKQWSSFVLINMVLLVNGNKCLWLWMAGIEMGLTWKRLAAVLKVFSYVFSRIGKNWLWIVILLKPLDIIPLQWSRSSLSNILALESSTFLINRHRYCLFNSNSLIVNSCTCAYSVQLLDRHTRDLSDVVGLVSFVIHFKISTSRPQSAWIFFVLNMIFCQFCSNSPLLWQLRNWERRKCVFQEQFLWNSKR